MYYKIQIKNALMFQKIKVHLKHLKSELQAGKTKSIVLTFKRRIKRLNTIIKTTSEVRTASTNQYLKSKARRTKNNYFTKINKKERRAVRANEGSRSRAKKEQSTTTRAIVSVF